MIENILPINGKLGMKIVQLPEGQGWKVREFERIAIEGSHHVMGPIEQSGQVQVNDQLVSINGTMALKDIPRLLQSGEALQLHFIRKRPT